jgi:hypothetical protein
MKSLYTIIWTAAWVYGEVTLIAADHWGWAIGSVMLQPVAVVHGAGHALGAW